MKKRNLKLIALGLTGLMGVAALTGCGSSKERVQRSARTDPLPWKK